MEIRTTTDIRKMSLMDLDEYSKFPEKEWVPVESLVEYIEETFEIYKSYKEPIPVRFTMLYARLKQKTRKVNDDLPWKEVYKGDYIKYGEDYEVLDKYTRKVNK